jgi:leukotriene-A4 hydrolase
MYPCADTPAVKFTYTASARAKGVDSGCSVLLSARRVSPVVSQQDLPTGTVFKYEQPVRIPSYLVAVAGGSVAYKAIGERCGVWGEKSQVNAAAWEFDGMEAFFKSAEKLVGKYEWGQYDVLVLPKSFPYGGMENPNQTFRAFLALCYADVDVSSVTPTLLAGDRSLVDGQSSLPLEAVLILGDSGSP